ncbi:MAG: ABC-2 transporter permease [Lachnospiraceae bacterium]|nr:ABC-2 transporter permease [Lachnospiraceae bacterium]
MGGLLYKDFIAIKGKRLVTTFAILTGIFVLLRFLFSNTAAYPNLRVVNDDGDVFTFIDMLLWQGEVMLLWLGGLFSLTFSAKILQCDAKNQTGHYLSALPISKKTFVASKYVFCGILLYVFFSLYEIWHIVACGFMEEGLVLDFSYLFSGIALPFLGTVMVILSIELPLFLVLGRDIAKVIKDGVALCIGLSAIAYLLFGDLNVFSRFDFGIIKTWMNTHTFEVFLVSLLTPPVTLGLYYLSYRIAVRFYHE